MISKWDLRHLGRARYNSTYSKDPSTKVGAVIARGKIVITDGYNGFAPGVQDLPERYNNRELKYRMIIHGEINAIHNTREDLTDCTLYTWPFMPCSVCAAQIIKRGISRIVAPFNDNPRWVDDFKISTLQFDEANVELCLVDLSQYPDF